MEKAEEALERLDQEYLIWRENNEVIKLGVQMIIVEVHLASHCKELIDLALLLALHATAQ